MPQILVIQIPEFFFIRAEYVFLYGLLFRRQSQRQGFLHSLDFLLEVYFSLDDPAHFNISLNHISAPIHTDSFHFSFRLLLAEVKAYDLGKLGVASIF